MFLLSEKSKYHIKTNKQKYYQYSKLNRVNIYQYLWLPPPATWFWSRPLFLLEVSKIKPGFSTLKEKCLCKEIFWNSLSFQNMQTRLTFSLTSNTTCETSTNTFTREKSHWIHSWKICFCWQFETTAGRQERLSNFRWCIKLGGVTVASDLKMMATQALLSLFSLSGSSEIELVKSF